MQRLGPFTLACVGALILLGLCWELWLAPLRPGGSMLVLKVVPLMAALPGLWSGRLRTFQWWSMLILLYLAEGLVRGYSDRGIGSILGWIEVGLSALTFVSILLLVRSARAASAIKEG